MANNTTIKKEIPFCPLLSAGCDIDKVCTRERCAWYMTSIQKCSMYTIAFNALLDANLKQVPKKRI